MRERTWTIIAGACLIVAAVFLLRDNMTVAFVAATLGVVAWFLRLRTQLRKSMTPDESVEAEEELNSSGDQDED